MKTIVVASGYFNVLHVGHVEYLEQAKALGDQLIVIVNNDKQLMLKNGVIFMPASERLKVVRSLNCVDLAIESVDEDRSVCKTLSLLHPHIFANGGDQTNEAIPESQVCNDMGIRMVDGLGEKIQSSSWLIAGNKP